MVPGFLHCPELGELGGCYPATSGSGSHIFFTLSSKQRKLEAQGSAEVTGVGGGGQEVRSTQPFTGRWLRGSRWLGVGWELGSHARCQVR